MICRFLILCWKLQATSQYTNKIFSTTTYLMTTKLLHFFVPKAFLKRMKEALR